MTYLETSLGREINNSNVYSITRKNIVFASKAEKKIK